MGWKWRKCREYRSEIRIVIQNNMQERGCKVTCTKNQIVRYLLVSDIIQEILNVTILYTNNVIKT